MNKPQDKKKAKKQNYFKKQQKKNNPKKEDAIPPIEENDFFRLNEEEKEHLNYLDKTYRDRAKERREAENENLEEEFLNDEPIFIDGISKGLNFELLKKEKEKEELALKEKIPNENEVSKENSQKLPKSILGMSLRNFLINGDLNDAKRKKNPIEDIHYEYDLDDIFGNDLPKIIIRKPKKQKEKYNEIIPNTNENLIEKMKKIMSYVKNKSGKQRDIQKNENLVKNNQERSQTLTKNNANLISIADEIYEDDDIFIDVKKDKIASIPPPIISMNNLDNSKKIFDDLKKTFQDQKSKENEIEKHLISEKFSNNANFFGNTDLTESLLPNMSSNKRPREEDDAGYLECFPEVELPSLEDLKQYREKHGISIKEAAQKSFADKKQYEQKKSKNKKKQLEKDAVKIKQMIQDTSEDN